MSILPDMVQNEGCDESGKENFTNTNSAQSRHGRRSFLKLCGTAAAAAVAGHSVTSTAAAATSESELRDQLSNASDGDVVTAAGDLEIDVTEEPIQIPSGVTLESTRSKANPDQGALFTSSEAITGESTGHVVMESGARLLRCRVKGHIESKEGEWGDSESIWDHASTGVLMSGDGCEVAGCKVSHLTWSGIADDGEGNVVHHNTLTYINGEGLGYAVHARGEAVDGEYAYNYFGQNRHSIGTNAGWWTAHHNYQNAKNTNHVFDVHDPAAQEYHVHNNTFHNDSYECFRLRDIPDEQSTVEQNWVAGYEELNEPVDSDEDAPFSEEGAGEEGEWLKLSFDDNHFGESKPDGNIGVEESQVGGMPEGKYLDATTPIGGSSSAEGSTSANGSAAAEGSTPANGSTTANESSPAEGSTVANESSPADCTTSDE